jgi:hypothetical protein
MAEISERDINRPAGWLIRVTSPGGPPEHFKVYEPNQGVAIERVRAYARVPHTDTCVALSELTLHELTGDNMTPGEVDTAERVLATIPLSLPQ